MVLMFSLVGTIVIFLTIVPNVISGYYYSDDVTKIVAKDTVLTSVEQFGRIGCMFFMTCNIWLWDLKLIADKLFIAYVAVTVFLLLIYYLLYLRYFIKGHNTVHLYDKVIIPVPLAIIPSLMFFAAGALRINIFLTFFSVIFAIPHIILSYKHSKIILESHKNGNS